MNDGEPQVERDEASSEEARVAERPRRAYAPPRIESGDAFEKVQLASGCNFSDPLEGCDPVC